MSDVVLVAPRPLRLASLSASQRQPYSPIARIVSPPVDTLTRVKLVDGDQYSEDDISSPSGRTSTSPRLNLSSDALEEFLSILRPSFFMPSSPTFRALRHEPGSTLMIERQQIFRPRDVSGSRSSPTGSVTAEDVDVVNTSGSSTPAIDDRQYGDNDQLVGNLWRIPGILESPVSRTNTRNPFQRHPSYERAFSSVLAAHLSPSLLPLPASPSPAPLSLSPPANQLYTECGEADP
ncbi:hypothetical protein EW145_g3865 [Phellinidium pouzarii]|uniref:Uncharacterized protein n=1 Tax=Phellinidium pouzarii TaxID=167371 RepID=A0A4S4LAS7_9AGAM|nr:hypothetical protein EW145_g3865 [Phellinidium pouzarii]